MSEKSFPFTDQQKSKMQHTAVKEEDRNEVSQSRPGSSRVSIFSDDQYGMDDGKIPIRLGCYMSEQPDSQMQHVGVKTEEREEPIARGRPLYLGEGAAGADPRVHMMYREAELSESDSSEDSTSELLAELARDYPDIAEAVEEERKEDERKRAEKRLRRR